MEAVSCVDTVLAPVAETARKAGANWINDVSGGGRDPAPARTLIRSSEVWAWTLPRPAMEQGWRPLRSPCHSDHQRIQKPVFKSNRQQT